MNINIPRYSLFGIAGSQEVDHSFVKFIIYPLTMIAFSLKERCILQFRTATKATVFLVHRHGLAA